MVGGPVALAPACKHAKHCHQPEHHLRTTYDAKASPNRKARLLLPAGRLPLEFIGSWEHVSHLQQKRYQLPRNGGSVGENRSFRNTTL
eukprot:613725-Amphidinium_carterae.1